MALPTTCPKCSTPLADQAKFCGKCGAVIEDTSLKTLMEFSAPPSVRALRAEATVPDAQAYKPSDPKLKGTLGGFAGFDPGTPPAPPPAAAPPPPAAPAAPPAPAAPAAGPVQSP